MNCSGWWKVSLTSNSPGSLIHRSRQSPLMCGMSRTVRLCPSPTATDYFKLEPWQQLWHVEELASQWGLDPARLGDAEAGNELGVQAVQIRLPGQATLLEYLRRCYALEEQVLAAVDDLPIQISCKLFIALLL